MAIATKWMVPFVVHTRTSVVVGARSIFHHSRWIAPPRSCRPFGEPRRGRRASGPPTGESAGLGEPATAMRKIARLCQLPESGR